MNLLSQLTNFNPDKRQISFKSMPIYKVNIKDINGNPVQAIIRKFDPEDAADLADLKGLCDYWNKLFHRKSSTAGYIKHIYDQFARKKENFEFWALELPDSQKNIAERILGFVNFKGDASFFNQISPERIVVREDKSFDNPDRNFKNIGSSLLYALSKYFKTTSFNKILLDSGNDRYYDHIKMPKLPSDYEFRYVDRSNVDSFIKNLEDKFDYNLQKIEQ